MRSGDRMGTWTFVTQPAFHFRTGDRTIIAIKCLRLFFCRNDANQMQGNPKLLFVCLEIMQNFYGIFRGSDAGSL